MCVYVLPMPLYGKKAIKNNQNAPPLNIRIINHGYTALSSPASYAWPVSFQSAHADNLLAYN